ncbi:phosphatase PAP2 family protein [Streptomyces uncialis]|uniref:phosphatase PAP2 family protein n=1 Tax=Streptomyces uncialis TaxID=1048205 RepID=UPI0009A10B53|nr:phosphatase PAP2 family protein [Streptomyces uncialis]MCX4662317.1 phosphatase PAP2 family protein [Streptomyces uncialis]
MQTVSPSSPPRPPRPAGARAPRAALVLFGLAALLLALVAARWSPLMDLDGRIARTTHRWAVAEPGLTHANRILTDWIWDPWAMRLLLAVVVLWLLRRREVRLACWLVATSLVGTLLQQSLKAAVGRERPSWPDPVDSAHFNAFPSGHALTATVVSGLVLWVLLRHGVAPALWRTAVALAVVSVLGAGLTRIWLGVHWPSDVLEGWLLGALMVTLAIVSYERTGGRPGRDRTDTAEADTARRDTARPDTAP